jgi:hypothetical protein
MGQWMWIKFYWPRHELEAIGQLQAPAALPPVEEPPVRIW